MAEPPTETTARPFLYVASPCYGGLAHARYMRSVLALRAACSKAGIALQLDLGGGEALASRGRAMMLARFLETQATHLLMVDGDQAFEADEVAAAIQTDDDVRRFGDGAILATRRRAQAVAGAPSARRARMGDVRNTVRAEIALPFETTIDHRRYAADPVEQAFALDEEAGR